MIVLACISSEGMITTITGMILYWFVFTLKAGGVYCSIIASTLCKYFISGVKIKAVAIVTQYSPPQLLFCF